jgi:hypothetical protein
MSCLQAKGLHSQSVISFSIFWLIFLQFQKRKYVKFERFQSGKKGYGLRLLEDVREGQFLIEYVGEVCLK